MLGQEGVLGRAVVIVQTILPEYRLPFFRELAARSTRPLELVIADGRLPSSQVQPSDRGRPAGSRRVGSWSVLGGRLLFQPAAIPPALAAEVTVLEFNPRIISNWVILLLRATLGRRTIFWGHAWSRSGQASWTNHLRSLLVRLAEGLIVYTEPERVEAEANLPVRSTWTARNAVFTEAEIRPVRHEGQINAFVLSGRLVAEKKPALAVDALARLGRDDALLIVVGEGPERAALEQLTSRHGVSGQVEFLGERYSYDELREVYGRCIASISAGYVGLSMTQSHAFGLPMLYPDNEPHAPEVEAAEEGVNAVTFRSDDPTSLASAMREVIDNRDEWIARRESISDACRANYSIERMVAGFLAAVDGEPMEE